MNPLVPTVAALAGACIFGVAGALQQYATHQVNAAPGDQRGFIRGLLRSPLWLATTVGSVAGFALQGVALATGPLVLVQPLLVTGVLFAAVTGALLRRRRPDPVLGSGLVLTAGGLALFLVAAQPSAGGDVLTLGDVIPLAAVLAVLVAGCLALALRTTGTARSLALALATGIVYGVTAAIAKVTIGVFSEGLVAVLTDWSLWLVVVLGPTGFFLNQLAFREGELVAPVVAVITVTDPLVGIGIGILWLGEAVQTSQTAVTGEVLGLLVMAAGVWVVAYRAPHLTGEAPSADAARSVSRRRPPGRRDAAAHPPVAASDGTTPGTAPPPRRSGRSRS
jgi:drug/metabolite transporter (DMT)-like permease